MHHPHLVVSISGHGFGHVAQTAPILNLLHERMPQLQLTVRSAVPLGHLRSRIHAPFTHLQSQGDIGMVMSSALDVRVEESRAAYRAFHAEWDARVADEARLLRELGADAVFSNVGYLPLAGAQRAGIANAALCSLNWFDIYRHYSRVNAPNSVRAEPVEARSVHASTGSARTDVISGRIVDETIAAQIHDCYANADAFLRATPGMAMETLPNLVPVAPIAAVGENRRAELNRHLRLSREEKLVLVSMGGIASRLPIERWPHIDGVRWLVQDSWKVDHPDAIVLESLPLSFSDLLSSSDALLCKPGYGSFVEATCSGTPVLYVDRPDWPEAPALVDWLQRNGVCREISRKQLKCGDIAKTLSELWTSPPSTPPIPDGAAQAADWLMHRLAPFG
jgi:UDP:flavonoid glycosyltransferase YjiC (YdhE family)